VERRADVPDSARRALYIGNLSLGMLQRCYRFSAEPEVQLEFLDWGIRLQRTLFKGLDYYEIRYEELTEARLTGKMLRRGIRFHADFLPQPLTFITADYPEVLDRLGRRGVPVNRNTAQLAPRGFGSI
jgi:hypothetical protein